MADTLLISVLLHGCGGFMFLPLFEGGRSRYLIQYLPCLLLLATFSFERAVANVRQLYAGYHRRVVAAIAADNLEQEK